MRTDTELCFEELYREYYGFVWRSLARLAVPSVSLDDAVHDTFMVVARRLDEFEGRGSLRSWLFGIAMRVAQAQRRDRARAFRREESLRNAATQPATIDPRSQREAASELSVLMAELDQPQRAVFLMAELEGKTAPEIAGELGVKLATVYSRLRLARQKLQARLLNRK